MRPQNPVAKKTSSRVSVAVLLATTLLVSTARTWSAPACGTLAAAMNPACCDELSASDPAVAVKAALLAANITTQEQFTTAADLTRLMLRGSSGLNTSASTDLKVPASGNNAAGRYTQAPRPPTNEFISLEFLAADAQREERKRHSLELSGQADMATGVTDQLRVRREFTPRHDAYISGSKATGFSFGFTHSPGGGVSNGDRAVAEDRQWRDRETATFNQTPSSRGRASEDANREPQGLRLFSWSW